MNKGVVMLLGPDQHFGALIPFYVILNTVVGIPYLRRQQQIAQRARHA